MMGAKFVRTQPISAESAVTVGSFNLRIYVSLINVNSKIGKV